MQETQADDRKHADMRPRVMVFFDYACQFCYLDWPRFKRLRSEHDVDLFLMPYELRPQMPAEGVPIEQIGRHSERVEEHMVRMAREADIGFMFPAFVPKTHLALALGEYARDEGPEAHEVLHEAIFSAYNARGEDIGNAEVLLDIAETHALDRTDVAAAFAEGRFDERLHEFLHLALSLGISATPSALICNELFIGTRPYEVLEESLRRCLIDEHAVERIIATGDPEEQEMVSVAEPVEGLPPTIDR